MESETLDSSLIGLFNYCNLLSDHLNPAIIFKNRSQILILIFCNENRLDFSKELKKYQSKITEFIYRLRYKIPIEIERKNYIDWCKKTAKGYKYNNNKNFINN